MDRLVFRVEQDSNKRARDRTAPRDIRILIRRAFDRTGIMGKLPSQSVVHWKGKAHVKMVFGS
jgi:hypothetical protein